MMYGQLKIEKIVWLAQEWIENFVFVDTETTSLENPHPIEVAIVTGSGDEVFVSRIRPPVPVDPGAYLVHRISDEDLVDEPTWEQIRQDVLPHIRRCFVSYNAHFEQLVFDTAQGRVGEFHGKCAMTLFSQFYSAVTGEPIRRHRLTFAAEFLGVPAFRAHGALADAKACADLVRAISRYSSNSELARN